MQSYMNYFSTVQGLRSWIYIAGGAAAIVVAVGTLYFKAEPKIMWAALASLPFALIIFWFVKDQNQSEKKLWQASVSSLKVTFIIFVLGIPFSSMIDGILQGDDSDLNLATDILVVVSSFFIVSAFFTLVAGMQYIMRKH